MLGNKPQLSTTSSRGFVSLLGRAVLAPGVCVTAGQIALEVSSAVVVHVSKTLLLPIWYLRMSG